MPATQSDRPEDTFRAREERLSAEECREAQAEIRRKLEELPELDQEAIFGADDLPVQRVVVPEWRGVVYVRPMMAEERDQWELFLYNHRGPDERANYRNLRATLAAFCLCDAAGTRLFTLEDVERLGRKSGKALDRVYEAARRLNRLSDEDVEDLAKNSPDGRSGSPPSGSAETLGSCTPTSSAGS